MQIAVCDDEPAQAAYLAALVKRWAEQIGHRAAVTTYPGAEAFLFAWEGGAQADILLLDIQMKVMSGMALAQKLRACGGRMAIVFITGFSEYMGEGYDVGALHYLLKPVDEKKLFQVLDRAAEALTSTEKLVLLAGAEGPLRLAVGGIVYAEAFSHVIELHESGRIHQLRMAMGELEKALGDGFFRCHRSYLVNMRHVRGVTRSSMVLESGKEIPLARRLYDDANQAFIRFC